MAAAPAEIEVLSPEGVPVDEAGVIQETDAIREQGLVEIRALMWEHFVENEESIRQSVQQGQETLRSTYEDVDAGEDATSASPEQLFALFFPKQDDLFLLAFLRGAYPPSGQPAFLCRPRHCTKLLYGEMSLAARKYRVADSFRVLLNFSNFWWERPHVRAFGRSSTNLLAAVLPCEASFFLVVRCAAT